MSKKKSIPGLTNKHFINYAWQFTDCTVQKYKGNQITLTEQTIIHTQSCAHTRTHIYLKLSTWAWTHAAHPTTRPDRFKTLTDVLIRFLHYTNTRFNLLNPTVVLIRSNYGPFSVPAYNKARTTFGD